MSFAIPHFSHRQTKKYRQERTSVKRTIPYQRESLNLCLPGLLLSLLPSIVILFSISLQQMPFGISHSKEIRDEVNLDTQTKLSYLILELGA